MKKISFVLITLLAISTTVFSKGIPVQGEWIITTVEEEGTSQEVYQQIEFVEDGTLLMMGMEIGKWTYNSSDKTITIESERVKEFAGTRNVNLLGKTGMTLETGGSEIHLLKYDKGKIEASNKKSGLEGAWKVAQEEGDWYLVFNYPDELVLVNSNMPSSVSHGTWMYLKDENVVILLVRKRTFSGKNLLKEVTNKSFVLVKNGNETKAIRVEQNAKNREELNFTEEEIDNYNENLNEDAAPEEEKLPWKDKQGFTAYLENVDSLVYQKSDLIAELNIFATTNITATVTTNPEYQTVQMDAIFEQFSSSNLNQNYFYPLDIGSQVRVITEQEITVAAGTFNCVVVEATDYSNEAKIKLYMIKNRPGVYAKVVISATQFGESTYTEYELKEIKGSFIKMENNPIIGNWLLVKSGTPKSQKTDVQEFDFIDDGRVMVSQWDYSSVYKWNFNSESNTVELIINEESVKLNVKVSDTEMQLTNDEKALTFVKFDLSTGHAINQKSGLVGYWILTNTEDEFQTMYLNNGDSVLGFDYYLKSPVSSNSFEYQGKWMFNDENSTLVLNVQDEQKNTRGIYQVTKKTEAVLVLTNGNKQLVYYKLDPEKVAVNNAQSGLVGGIWKHVKPDGSTVFYEFKNTFEFYYGRETKDDMMHYETWMYNPETQMLFVGAQVHYIGSDHKIIKSSATTIEFNNTLKLEKVE